MYQGFQVVDKILKIVQVLENISWTVREGERWHLIGPNGSSRLILIVSYSINPTLFCVGSGKTTLLSVLTGDHPQSYIQKHLTLFGKPRRALATSQIQQKIGIVSPEIFNAFPRRLGHDALSVRDAIATGFESTYSYRRCTPEQDARIDELLTAFERGPGSGFDSLQPFASLVMGDQSLVLLLRALVNSPPLLILDEVFAGMDDAIVRTAKRFLRERLGPKQSVIFVTHWEEELPWSGSEIQRITLGE